MLLVRLEMGMIYYGNPDPLPAANGSYISCQVDQRYFQIKFLSFSSQFLFFELLIFREHNSTLALRECQGKNEFIPFRNLYQGLLTARDCSRHRGGSSGGGVSKENN